MSPLEKEVIRRKLAVITENLKALEPIKGMPTEEYIGNVYKRKATERLLQELIEAAIDINTHIIVQTGGAAPDDYYESFIKAGELKIISPDLAEKLAPSAGLRNRLVHEYDLLEHSMVLEAVSIVEDSILSTSKKSRIVFQIILVQNSIDEKAEHVINTRRIKDGLLFN